MNGLPIAPSEPPAAAPGKSGVTRSTRALALSVALAALAYLGLSLWAGWRDVLAASLALGPALFVGLLALSLVNYLLRFWRWQIYLGRLGATVPWRDSLRIYLAGFALTTTPGKLGETMRSLFLKPHGVPTTASLAAFFAERASDLLAILLIAALGLWSYPPARPVACAALALIVLALLLASSSALWRRVAAWSAARPGRLARLLARLAATADDFRRCFAPAAFGAGTALGLAAWLAEGIGFWWLLHALGAPLDPANALFIYAFAMLVGGLSFLPGGLGSSEATMIGLLALNGLPEASAVTATIICRLATLWFAVALGIFCLLRGRSAGHPAEPAQ